MAIVDLKNNNCNKEEIFTLLQQLTTSPSITSEQYCNIISTLNEKHNIFSYVENNKTVGLITIFIEQKLIHGGKCVAHIEDLVIDKNYRKRGIATKLITHALKSVEKMNCYKIILNCTEEMVEMYKKFNFEKKSVQMAYYTN